MAESITARLGLPRWSANTDTPNRTEFDSAMSELEDNAAMFAQGIRADRPAPGKAGRFYKVVGDTALLNGVTYYDDGVAWTIEGANVEGMVARASAAGTLPLVAKGFAGQTAELQQWRSSADVVLASVDKDGKGTFAALAVVGLSTLTGAVTITGALAANSGVSTTTVQSSGDATLSRIKSTALRVDGNPKTDLKLDGTARLDGLIPPGFIGMTGAAAAPAGWLLCNGAAVSRATYADLFAVIGTAHGVGDGSTTFNVPDMRDLFPVGASGTKALASTGGANSRVIPVGALPAHTHPIDHNHAAATTSTDGSHDHTAGHSTDIGGSSLYFRRGGGGTLITDGGLINNDGYHDHTLDLPNFTGNSGSTGAGSSMDMTPAFRALNYLIKS